jgi:hypothetical protein
VVGVDIVIALEGCRGLFVFVFFLHLFFTLFVC